ncbi:hypothetical protein RM863_15055 [Streptomyces sp. DSM 41014]|uniref:Extensin n=1 Tax=Streptomyces hintoniae TaxID=3075521 RepID=A0ABU2UKD8_9ACTN|nr:hypothetical protein [Streptomyces sp. DSM 41014]MDT0473446.1 hypothetical protein [Streptomyces sp. DSM 41014]
MADEQFRWLDRATAEILLRGESLEAVPDDTRDQAERLARTLESLTAEPAKPGAELPGEAAALAAFRAARADRDQARDRTAGPARTRSSDAGLVRIGGPERNPGRPRWSRPVRLGLTAVLAAGMVGGVAVAATSGVLPTPFIRDDPSPAASVSAAATPERPLGSPSPKGVLPGEPTPGEPTAATPGDDTRDRPPGGQASGDDSTPGRWSGAPAACRDVRDGKELTADRRRALQGAAGGPGRVRSYCRTVLTGAGGTGGTGGTGHDSEGGGQGRPGAGGEGQGDRPGGKGGQGEQSDDEGHHIAPGGKGDGDGGGDGGKGSGDGYGSGHSSGHGHGQGAGYGHGHGHGRHRGGVDHDGDHEGDGQGGRRHTDGSTDLTPTYRALKSASAKSL